jgi:hypothetical protein
MELSQASGSTLHTAAWWLLSICSDSLSGVFYLQFNILKKLGYAVVIPPKARCIATISEPKNCLAVIILKVLSARLKELEKKVS